MRIIAGTARGKQLQTFDGCAVRPTSDRAREALFSMLNSRLPGWSGLRVLDAFAGTGALGLEALSRGAAFACLVEKDAVAARMVQANINHCGFTANSQLVRQDALGHLTGPAPALPFDLVFLDPPYGQRLVERCLPLLTAGGWLQPDSLVCIEADGKDKVPEDVPGYTCLVRRRYGRAEILLLARCDASCETTTI